MKVVLDANGFALYFSRAPIPFRRKDTGIAPLQHVGLYVYRRDFLFEIVKLERSPAECAEELEQLRALENGYRIRAAEIEGWTSVPVDVPEDVARSSKPRSRRSRSAGRTKREERAHHGRHGSGMGSSAIRTGAAGAPTTSSAH